MSSVEYCSKSELGRCETMGLSAAPRVTATSPSNLALPVHRPLHTYDTNIFYVTGRAQTISAPQSLSEPESHTNDIVDRMEKADVWFLASAGGNMQR